jgi:hypothetical protein
MSSSVLMYLRNYRQDLEYWMQDEEISSMNFLTSGTPTFKTIEEAKTYLGALEETIKTLE